MSGVYQLHSIIRSRSNDCLCNVGPITQV